jgi:hypothetical protein
MATKTVPATTPLAAPATVDPLAGIPTGTAQPVKAPKAKAPAAPTGGTVINLNAAKKRRRLTGQAFKDAQKFARDMVGYDSSSPIWGRKLVDVIQDIEAAQERATEALATSTYKDVSEALVDANVLTTEIKKRLAYGQIMKAQS